MNKHQIEEKELVNRLSKGCFCCTCWRCEGFCSDKECKKCEKIIEKYKTDLKINRVKQS